MANNDLIGDDDDGTISPYAEPVNLETRPLQNNNDKNENESQEPFEEEDSNQVTDEVLPVYTQEEQNIRLSVLQQQDDSEEEERPCQQPADGFHVAVSGEDLDLQNVASTMFAQMHKQSTLTDDTSLEQQAHMAAQPQHIQPVMTEDMEVTDHSNVLVQEGLSDDFEVLTMDTIAINHQNEDMKIQRESGTAQGDEEAGEDQWQNQYMESENYVHGEQKQEQIQY